MAKRRTPRPLTRSRAKEPASDLSLLWEIAGLIREARQQAASTVNSVLVQLYWQVGHRIRSAVLREKRAEYGRQILSTLSKELVAEFGDGFSVPN